MPILLFLLTVVSRLPFTSAYLYQMDSGHFALALADYDLKLHQPHPPGYFLYVMLGRLVHLLIPDANTTFVLIGILFSGLTVVTIYYLGMEMFDKRTGTVAAFIALFSPNFWFHGEVALTYTVEAFFSALVGLLCWRLSRSRTGYLWHSVALLGVAGGFRQTGAVFLFPLWLFSARKESLPRIGAALALGAIVVLSWLIPMLAMTGGADAYLAAFRELWLFNTGHNSVFENGPVRLKEFALILTAFLFFSMGAALPLSALALYALVRTGRLPLLLRRETAFLAFWILPAFLFYLLVFIHPSNPGYALIMLPPLTLACSNAIMFLVDELKKFTTRDLSSALVCIVLLSNAGIFLLARIHTSRWELVEHDRNTAAVLRELSAFNPEKTALFTGPYHYYGYRHLMVYLPRFTVYQVDVRRSSSGEMRKQFGGKDRKTFLTEEICLPKEITSFAAVVVDDPKEKPKIHPRLAVTRITPHIRIVSGPIKGIGDLFPELGPVCRLDNH